MTTLSQPSLLNKKLFLNVTTATALLLVIMALSLGLHVYNIQSIGDANAYYTAAVKSMLQSWHNFFFVAAEPGGSVTVDKPPLGLWIEAVFAYFLGVSGFSVSLPNILAGVFGIPFLYHLVKKYMGALAGLVAALVMALTPVYVATNRNNTMDGMLVFFLLLAAWAFIKAAEVGKLRWVLLGAFIVGLGFNIKMLQAFLPLPAFYALYFFASKEGWLRKIFNLSAATILLLVVSLSWALVVDSIPADQRPFIGSSQDNTVMSLITGHNGTSRIFGGFFGGGRNRDDGQTVQMTGQPASPSQSSSQPQQGPPPQALAACENQTQGSACSFTRPNGDTINGSCITPPNTDQLACAPQGMIPQNGGAPAGGPNQGGTPFSNETGSPGAFRFFTQPLSKQMSWLLPFALIGILIALFAAKIKLPLESNAHKAILLWGGWLLTCVVFFSMISGIFHAYYAIMLVPPLGAVVGIGFAQLWDWGKDRSWAGVLLILAAAVTFGFQIFATIQYGEKTLWLFVAGGLLLAGSLMMFFQKKLAYLTILAALIVVPAYWTVMTTVSNANQNLPTAYTGTTEQVGPNGFARQQNDDGQGSAANEDLVNYLQANTQDVEYLVAVPSSQQGSTLVLATGRPVLFMGGFGGQDDVVNAEDLSQMVANGELRYILYGGDRGNKQVIANWLTASCEVVPQFSGASAQGANPLDGQSQPQGPGRSGQSLNLYECLP
ncbi:MAG: glycosyltransferase family 39 protein [Anaerolineales bacterium]|nr:glycosyltransferase family 39 protein [Anaerolineales bacterium]